MKYVAAMKMQTTITIEAIDKLLSSLELYLKEHPPIPDVTFGLMLELAEKLDHDKLKEQCIVAQARCKETQELLKVRQNTLKRAKEQLQFEQEHQVSCSRIDSVLETDSCPVWVPQDSSTPVPLSIPGVMLRRRSYAGKSSTPLYSPSAAAFKSNVKNDTNVLEYEEYFLHEDIITEDMSDRIVASFPKGLSDSTLRNSRESLHGSRESLRGSCENLSRDQKSSSLPRELPASLPNSFSANNNSNINGTTLNKHNRPHRKMMRRINTVMTGAEGEVLETTSREQRRSTKSISMITGSTESLPR